MNKSIWILAVLSFLLSSCKYEAQPNESKSQLEEPLDPMDAVIAAPDSHEVLLENEKVRVLRVSIPPGEKEPMHNHNWESVMIVDQPSRIKYYDAQGKLVFETEDEDFSYSPRDPNWMSSEGIHAVENIDSVEFSALRIELKK